MKNGNPYFSIIIPTYNRAKTVSRAINSVFSQSFKDFELLVVDDGSDDGTDELCRKMNLIYISIDNNGVSHARNTGAMKANGKWLAFLDSDDEWLPNKLEKQYNFIQQHPNCQILHGNEKWIKNGKVKYQKAHHKKSGGELFKKSLSLCLISPSAVVIKKDLFFKHDGFRVDFPVCEDYDLWLKITSSKDVGFIDDVIVNKYGGHKDQLSNRYVAMDYWRVISIDWILNNLILTEEFRTSAINELRKKCKILLSGYIKHNNMANYGKIDKIVAFYENHETF